MFAAIRLFLLRASQLLNVEGSFFSILSFLSQTISKKLLKLSYAIFLISKIFDSHTPNATFTATALPKKSLSKKMVVKVMRSRRMVVSSSRTCSIIQRWAHRVAAGSQNMLCNMRIKRSLSMMLKSQSYCSHKSFLRLTAPPMISAVESVVAAFFYWWSYKVWYFQKLSKNDKIQRQSSTLWYRQMRQGLGVKSVAFWSSGTRAAATRMRLLEPEAYPKLIVMEWN